MPNKLVNVCGLYFCRWKPCIKTTLYISPTKDLHKRVCSPHGLDHEAQVPHPQAFFRRLRIQACQDVARDRDGGSLGRCPLASAGKVFAGRPWVESPSRV